MLLLVGAFLVSLIPSIGLFLWLRKIEGDEEFEGLCNKAMQTGLISVFPVVAVSLCLNLVQLGLSLAFGLSGVPKAAFYTIIVMAFSEELVKFLCFRWLLGKHRRAWSWMDYIILMTIVGLGFGLAEDIPYAIGTNAIQMLVRGVTVMHGGFGFIMGYFMGKGERTGNNVWSVIGFVMPWLMHGLYDFGLSEEVLVFGEGIMYLSLSLAAAALVIVIVLIVFMFRHKDDPTYREPMHREIAGQN